MIVTPELAKAVGIPHGRDEHLAALVHGIRSPLAAIWNAVHLLTYARDEATVEKVRQMVARQLEHLSHVLDNAEAQRLNGEGPEQGSAAADGVPDA